MRTGGPHLAAQKKYCRERRKGILESGAWGEGRKSEEVKDNKRQSKKKLVSQTAFPRGVRPKWNRKNQQLPALSPGGKRDPEKKGRGTITQDHETMALVWFGQRRGRH